MNQENTQQRLTHILRRIHDAALIAGRNSNDITLVGAAKQQPESIVTDCVEKGLKHIGHNYVQEAEQAQTYLKNLPICWHYMGQIQSNKTRQIATFFDWVHSVDRFKIAQRLSTHRLTQNSQLAESLHVLLQINIDNEQAKAGAALKELDTLTQKIAALESINLRGFMVLPKPCHNLDQQRAPFAKARELLTLYNQRHGLKMDTLSMGMSNDLEAAIIEGSTMVRIGSALFGPRG